jgi:alkanesulfonate monooxygenase SsuD/methylene tetrahydromethanopterin reductase-like flavin-dependent oxidoreductase (luciferase family)
MDAAGVRDGGCALDRIGPGMDEVVAAMRACWGPDPVEYQGRWYRIAPSEGNPKPVQAHLPVLLGVATPAGARRPGRIADGINPIAFSAEVVPALATVFRQAAEAAGRDPAGLTVVVSGQHPPYPRAAR